MSGSDPRLDALEARIKALETWAATSPPPPVVVPPAPTFIESPVRTLVTVPFSTMEGAVAGKGVIIGRNGGKFRLIAGGRLEYTPLGGTSVVMGAGVILLFYGDDHLLYQQATTRKSWWRTDDVSPIAWSQEITASTPPPGYTPPVTVPPVVSPPDPPVSTVGIKGKRIAEMLASFGVNVYYNGQGGTLNGVANNLAALRYLGGDDKADMICRQYAAGSGAEHISFSDAIHATMPNVLWNICITYDSSFAIVDRVARASASGGKWLKYTEGRNEPNLTANFGWGATSPQECLNFQKQVFDLSRAVGIQCIAPAIARTSGDANYIQTYYGDTLPQINALSDVGNSHVYPNHGSPHAEGDRLTVGVWQKFGKTKGLITEFGPKHYQQETVPDDNTAAYFELLALINGHANFGLIGLQHWPVSDYRDHGQDGMFNSYNSSGGWVGADPNKPRPVATAIRALNLLCADRADNRFTFDPGSLDIKVEGLPSGKNSACGGHFAVYRGTDGVWDLFIWNEQDKRSISSVPVTVTLGVTAGKVVDYSLTRVITERPSALRTLTAAKTFTVDLGAEVRLLQITP